MKRKNGTGCRPPCIECSRVSRHAWILSEIRRRRLQQDLDAEPAFHREMPVDHVNQVLLGNTGSVKEQALDLWRFNFIETSGAIRFMQLADCVEIPRWSRAPYHRWVLESALIPRCFRWAFNSFQHAIGSVVGIRPGGNTHTVQRRWIL
jgi:hypothetical protein